MTHEPRTGHAEARSRPRSRDRAQGPRRVDLRPGHLVPDGDRAGRDPGGRLAGPGLRDATRPYASRVTAAACRSSRSAAGAAAVPRARRLDREDRRRRGRRRRVGLEQPGRGGRLRGAVGAADARRDARRGRRGRRRAWPRSTSAPSCPAAGRSPAASGRPSSAPAGPAWASGPATAASPASSAGASSSTRARPPRNTPASSTPSASSWPSSPGPISSSTSRTSPSRTADQAVRHRARRTTGSTSSGKGGAGRPRTSRCSRRRASRSARTSFQFYPRGSRSGSPELEVSYKGRQPGEIRVTRFQVVPEGQRLRFQGHRAGDAEVEPSSIRPYDVPTHVRRCLQPTTPLTDDRMATLEVHDGQGRVQFVELARDHPVLFGTSPALRRRPGGRGDQAGPRADPLEEGAVQGRGLARRRVRADQRPQDDDRQHRTRATRSRSARAGSSCCGSTRRT